MSLLDELERVLGISAYPINWPLGNGPDFRGVFDRQTNEVHLFERTQFGAYRAPREVKGIDDPLVRDVLRISRLEREFDVYDDPAQALSLMLG